MFHTHKPKKIHPTPSEVDQKFKELDREFLKLNIALNQSLIFGIKNALNELDQMGEDENKLSPKNQNTVLTANESRLFKRSSSYFSPNASEWAEDKEHYYKK